MKKTISIIQKNFQLIFNMKASSLMIILGPLLLISLIGVALHDTSIKNIKAGIYADGADQEFLDGIQAKLYARSINSQIYEDLYWCKEDVKNEIIQICLELKPAQTGELGEVTQQMIMHVDFSKQRTVWNIIGRIKGIVDDETTKYQEESIENIKQELEDLKSESKDIESQLNNAITTLEQINKQLKNIENKEDSTKHNLEKIEDNIEQVEEELESLEDVFISYSVPTSLYSSELFGIKSSITQIKLTINTINSELDTYNIKQIRDETDDAIDELEKNKKKVKNIQEKIDQTTNKNIDQLMNPIQLSHQSVLDSTEGDIQTNLEFLDYLFPSFLIFFILFDSIIFSASMRIRERKSSSYVRNIVSKTRPRSFILGDFITSVIIISIQITGIIILASFFLNLSIMNNLTTIILLTILSVAIFSLIGITIGSIFKSQESVIISSISISLLFFIFSSLITPLETLPGKMALIIKHAPLTLLEAKLRLTTIFNLPLQFSPSEIFATILTITACIAITSFYYKKNKTKEI